MHWLYGTVSYKILDRKRGKYRKNDDSGSEELSCDFIFQGNRIVLIV